MKDKNNLTEIFASDQLKNFHDEVAKNTTYKIIFIVFQLFHKNL